jgi:hypothetical protein
MSKHPVVALLAGVAYERTQDRRATDSAPGIVADVFAEAVKGLLVRLRERAGSGP